MPKKREPSAEEQADTDRLRIAWDEAKVRLGLSPEQVAFQCGWKTQSAFSQYLTGAVPLNLEALLKIAKVLQIEPRTISERLTRVLPTSSEHRRGIPVVGNTQGGPDRQWVEMGYPAGYGAEYVDVVSKDANAYILRVRGSSMSPRMREGELIMVEPNTPAEPGDEVVVQTLKGDVMVKVLVSMRNGEITLDSIAQDFARIVLPLTSIQSMHPVMGVFPAKSILIRKTP